MGIMDTIALKPGDNVVVALREIAQGECVTSCGETIRVQDRIPLGHKIARCKIPEGVIIRKFGIPVGIAVSTIEKGGHVHVHNVKSIYMDNEQNYYES